MTTETKTLKFAAIAALAIGAQLEDGTFAGILTTSAGTHVAVVLLPAKPDKRLTWKDAVAWAESVDGELPTRPVSALLYANAKAEFESTWHWTSQTLDQDTGDEDDASGAWYCFFGNGYQFYNGKSGAGAARAVRLIHLES